MCRAPRLVTVTRLVFRLIRCVIPGFAGAGRAARGAHGAPNGGVPLRPASATRSLSLPAPFGSTSRAPFLFLGLALIPRNCRIPLQTTLSPEPSNLQLLKCAATSPSGQQSDRQQDRHIWLSMDASHVHTDASRNSDRTQYAHLCEISAIVPPICARSKTV